MKLGNGRRIDKWKEEERRELECFCSQHWKSNDDLWFERMFWGDFHGYSIETNSIFGVDEWFIERVEYSKHSNDTNVTGRE